MSIYEFSAAVDGHIEANGGGSPPDFTRADLNDLTRRYPD